MQFFLKKHVKYLVRLKQCAIFASHTSTHNFHIMIPHVFSVISVRYFFGTIHNNSYICAILFILSNYFMFFRLGFPFCPSGFLLRKSSKNDPYFRALFDILLTISLGYSQNNFIVATECFHEPHKCLSAFRNHSFSRVPAYKYATQSVGWSVP